ncbi:MAG: hypothetical protein Q7R49_02230 [Candidatus Daviesbacteria bacterium]|nr:hypothetical protein [Candidatus Daviesbacteria bacterium]
MLESLGNTNIGNLNLEEPKPKAGFPFGITEQDWDNMVECCKDSNRPNILIPDFQIRLATSMRLLFPDRRQSNLDKSSRIWEFLEKQVKDIRSSLRQVENYNPNSTKLDDFCTYVLAAKVLFPDKLKSLRMEANWLALQPFFEKYGYYFGEEGGSLEPAFKLKMVYPEKKLPTISEEDLKLVIDKVNHSSNLSSAVEASFIKVLFPGRLEANEAFIPLLRSNLDRFLRTANSVITYADFMNKIMAMKILVAESVRVTEKGLEFIMPGEESFNLKVPVLPETRKF